MKRIAEEEKDGTADAGRRIRVEDILDRVKEVFGEVTQYLVTTFKDSTGRKHTHITKAKSNQKVYSC